MANDFAWLDNNRIIYDEDDKFAFTLVTSTTLVSTHATPWIANVDG
jgi:hypothetical protein